MERLKAAAAERGATITTLVLAWVEAGLDAGLDASRPVPRSGLDQRLDAVERRLDALEAPAPPKPASPRQGTAASPEKAKPPSIPGDAITTAELAEERLGLNRRTFNERLRRGGGARAGLVVEGWRCVGQSAPPAGGPLRWMWEPVGT